MLQGGFPEAIARSRPRARRWHLQYLESILERDVRDVASIRDGGELRRLVELCALRTASLLNVSTLAGELGIDRETVTGYLAVLERVFLLRRLPAWHANASARLVKTPKVHLCDTGLCAALADLDGAALDRARERFGGIVLYDGDDCLPMAGGMLAVPVAWLWSR